MRKEEFDPKNAELDPEQKDQIRGLVDLFFPPDWAQKAWEGWLEYIKTPIRKPENCPIYTMPTAEESAKILEEMHRKAEIRRFECGAEIKGKVQ